MGTLGERGKVWLAGFLAGALTFLTVMIGVEIFFFLAGFMGMLGALAQQHGLGLEEQSRLTWGLLLIGLLNAGATALSHIWGVRLGFVVLGGVGAIAGRIQFLAGRLGSHRAHRLGLLTVVAIVNMAILLWELARRQTLSEWLVRSPQAFAWRALLLESYATSLIVGVALAVPLAYVIWELWHWWDERLRGLVRLFETTPQEEITTMGRLSQARFWMAVASAALALCLLLLIPLSRFYEREGPSTLSGERWLDRTTSQVAISLVLDKQPDRVSVSNVQGLGQVKVFVSDRPGGEALRWAEPMTLTDDIHQYAYAEISLQGLPASTYYLHLVISGSDARGLMRYIALQGGTGLAGVASWLMALTITGALLATMVLLFEAAELVRIE